MDKILRTILLVIIAILYSTTVFMFSRAIFPEPDQNCSIMTQENQNCWENYENLRKQTQTSQKLFSLILSVISVAILYTLKIDNDIKLSLLVGAGITAIISSGIKNFVLIGAILTGITLIGIIWLLTKN